MLRAHRAGRRHRDDVGARSARARRAAGATRRFARRYPHQLSGGQQQRVTIAIALRLRAAGRRARRADDRPRRASPRRASSTSSIGCGASSGMAMVYVSHDLAVVARIADRIAVMYAGRIVEEGPAAECSRGRATRTRAGSSRRSPTHAHAARAARHAGRRASASASGRPGCAFAPRCPHAVERCDAAVPRARRRSAPGARACAASDWRRRSDAGARRGRAARPSAPRAARRCSRSTGSMRAPGTARAVVAGRRTSRSRSARASASRWSASPAAARPRSRRCVAGLHEPSAGRIAARRRAARRRRAKRRSTAQRRRIQIVFQNPSDVAQPAAPRRRRRSRARRASCAGSTRARRRAEVGAPARARAAAGAPRRPLPARALRRRAPARRDRARARRQPRPADLRRDHLGARRVGAGAVLELLVELRRELGLACCFITHDLGVVASVADRVLVLEGGQLRESGPVDQVLAVPEHPYTRRLLDAAPSLSAVVAPAR